MPFTLTMPKLSPTMESGTIAKWKKKEGDLVKAGDVIFEVATDKATVEHAVLDGGYLRKILVKDGGEAVVNQPVAIFTEKADESIEGYKPEGVQAAAAPQMAQKTESTTPKAAAAPATTTMMAQPAFAPEAPLQAVIFETPASGSPASPLAKKLAKEKGIDLSTIVGSGPGHRVMSRDLDMGQPDLAVTFGRVEKPEIPSGTFEEEPLTPMRKVISQRLQASKTYIPHFYATVEVRSENILSMREQLKNMGLKVSVNDCIIRASALALRQHPQVNSGFNSANQTLIRFKTIDISVAVSVESGLITPIIRYADYKNLGEISVEMKALASKARAGKLAREEYAGGSFTISNLGMFGVSEFMAIINPPQAAILAVGTIEDRAVVQDGLVVPGKVMKLTLSGDHRVIDGAEGGKFLSTVKRFLESPAALLLS